MASRKPPERSDPSCGSFALLRRRFETVPFVHRARVKARRALRACTRWQPRPEPRLRRKAMGEDRYLQRQRYQRPSAGTPALARRGRAGRRLPAGIEAAALRDAGYGAIWHGQKSWNGVAILARGADPTETGRGLPGDLEGTQSRYIEAAVAGVIIGCLYLPNGNPAPRPKFDYKLRWFARLSAGFGRA